MYNKNRSNFNTDRYGLVGYGYVSTGQGVLGHNMYAYCGNNPINRIDPTGEAWTDFVVEWTRKIIQSICDFFDSNIIRYDVPLYNQKNLNLCWAYCQIMTEDYHAGISSPTNEVDARAKELAILENGEANWNSGDWPTNKGAGVAASKISNIFKLADELQNGPVYAYYDDKSIKGGAHLIVVTGVNCFSNSVYTNNPWGISGIQSFNEFKNGFVGDYKNNRPLDYIYRIVY